MTHVALLVSTGLVINASLCAWESRALPRALCPSWAGSQTSLRGCPESHPNVRKAGLPVGTSRAALCRHVAWAGQGCYMTANLTGARHRPLQQQMPSRGISVRSAWLLSTPIPFSLPPVPGLCQHGPYWLCPSGMEHCGQEWISGLPHPPQPGRLWPLRVWWLESLYQGKSLLCSVPTKW